MAIPVAAEGCDGARVERYPVSGIRYPDSGYRIADTHP
jgi:hypothetical protein